MAIVFHKKDIHIGAHHRLWLILATAIAFLMAVLWAQPVG